MLRNAPKFHEVAKRIVEITEECIIVAHNAHFDYRILRTEFRRLGYTFKRKSICTVELAERLIPKEESFSLGKLSRSLGIPISDRHRAEGDAMATVKLFKVLLNKDSEKSVVKETINFNEAIELKQNHKDIIENLPSETGVFYFYDKKGRIFFIGKSRNIKHRVSQYLTDERSKSKKMQKLLATATFERTGSELIAQLKLRDEIIRHKPFFNTWSKKPVFTYALYGTIDEDGYINLNVAGYNLNKEPLTTFSNMHSAKQYLVGIIKKHNFCNSKCSQNKEDGACMGVENGTCLGACINQESPESYNDRVLELVNTISVNNKSVAILDKGRSKEERSVIYVKNGNLKGFGYTNLNHQINNVAILEKLISPLENSTTALHVIASYLRREKHGKIINL